MDKDHPSKSCFRNQDISLVLNKTKETKSIRK